MRGEGEQEEGEKKKRGPPAPNHGGVRAEAELKRVGALLAAPFIAAPSLLAAPFVLCCSPIRGGGGAFHSSSTVIFELV